MDEEEKCQLVAALVAEIEPILHGHDPDVKTAVISDLLATHLAGYQGAGAAELREVILEMHLQAVRWLIPVNERLKVTTQ